MTARLASLDLDMRTNVSQVGTLPGVPFWRAADRGRLARGAAWPRRVLGSWPADAARAAGDRGDERGRPRLRTVSRGGYVGGIGGCDQGSRF